MSCPYLNETTDRNRRAAVNCMQSGAAECAEIPVRLQDESIMSQLLIDINESRRDFRARIAILRGVIA